MLWRYVQSRQEIQEESSGALVVRIHMIKQLIVKRMTLHNGH